MTLKYSIPAGLVALVLALAGAMTARAELVVQDDFSGGTRTNDTGLLAGFLTTTDPGASLTVIDDSGAGGLGSTEALDMDVGANYHGAAGIFDITGPAYDDVSLDIPGNSLEMRFRWRMSAIGDNNELRVGILNNGGTQQTVDAQTSGENSTDTIGFGVGIPIRTSPGNGNLRFLEDTNEDPSGNNYILGGGNLWAGIAGSVPAISNTTPHEGVFRLTRTSTGYDLEAQIDGGTPQTMSRATTPTQVFHQLGFVSASQNNDFILDDVELDKNALRNGTLERGDLQGDGTFDDFERNWTVSSAAASAHQGLRSGSHTAAYLDASTDGDFEQSPDFTHPDWQFGVDFAAEDPGGAGARSFNLRLQNAGNGGEINLRLKWDPLESTCRHASLSIL